MWKLNKDKCTACGECIKVCAPQALEMIDSYPQLKSSAECLLCSMCADTCPEGAIEISIDQQQCCAVSK